MTLITALTSLLHQAREVKNMIITSFIGRQEGEGEMKTIMSHRSGKEHGHETRYLFLFLCLATLSILLTALSSDTFARSSAVVRVTARVMAYAQMRVTHSIPEVIVTTDDIRRGYTMAPSATRLEVKSNTGYTILVHGFSDTFKSAWLTGLRDMERIYVSESSNSIPVPFKRPAGRADSMEIDYRILLSENTEPGRYAWPFSLSINY